MCTRTGGHLVSEQRLGQGACVNLGLSLSPREGIREAQELSPMQGDKNKVDTLTVRAFLFNAAGKAKTTNQLITVTSLPAAASLLLY